MVTSLDPTVPVIADADTRHSVPAHLPLYAQRTHLCESISVPYGSTMSRAIRLDVCVCQACVIPSRLAAATASESASESGYKRFAVRNQIFLRFTPLPWLRHCLTFTSIPPTTMSGHTQPPSPIETDGPPPPTSYPKERRFKLSRFVFRVQLFVI